MKTLHANAIAVALCVALAPAFAQDELSDPIERDVPQGAIQVALQPLATGLAAPNWGISAPGLPGTLFVVDQPGTLWSIDLPSGAKRPFLDVSGLLVQLGAFGPGTFDERGFLGIAFHPDYASNGLLYTYTSEPASAPADFSTMPPGTPPDHQSVIREWRIAEPGNPLSAGSPATGRVLMRVDQPQFNHNAGAMNFGPDGLLYIAFGDGGAADDQGVGHSPQGNGQDPSNILGSIVRIDPSGSSAANGQYGIPVDNPFVTRAGFVPEIWAYGLRNPFRFSFDTATGTLYTGDVGQNNIEEVDVIVRGGNYGWRVKEGAFLFEPAAPDEEGFVTAFSPGQPSGLIDPIAQYDHDDGVAVIGGFVYHGTTVPVLANHYVFADNSRRLNNEHGRLWYLDPRAVNAQRKNLERLGRAAAASMPRTRMFEALDGPIGEAILGLGQDAAGEVYVLTNETNVPAGTTGVVYRIVPRCPDGEVGEICD